MDSFRGRIVHTAQWPDDFGPEQWKGQNIAVIGAGASSVQTTPGYFPHLTRPHGIVVKHQANMLKSSTVRQAR